MKKQNKAEGKLEILTMIKSAKKPIHIFLDELTIVIIATSTACPPRAADLSR
jgi:hypothetical protein